MEEEEGGECGGGREKNSNIIHVRWNDTCGYRAVEDGCGSGSFWLVVGGKWEQHHTWSHKPLKEGPPGGILSCDVFLFMGVSTKKEMKVHHHHHHHLFCC
ncbi:hypothetical protein RJT34_24894 [Clitoria ternatea]|uniref:Uncharacterized protein n=1 Tax=Clitoria ternatea TaxID=43366 RepID=A0AAN9ILC0_CLITE